MQQMHGEQDAYMRKAAELQHDSKSYPLMLPASAILQRDRCSALTKRTLHHQQTSKNKLRMH